MAIDAHKNFAYSTVATAPSPASSGTSLTVASGDGGLFPATPFNATVWPAGAQPTTGNSEIVRVTSLTGDVFTLATRPTGTEVVNQSRSIVVGDQVAASITAKTLTDIDANYVNSWSPYVVASGGTGLQTLASNFSNSSGVGTLVLFPFQITNPLRFNQIIVPQSLSYVTSNRTEAINATFVSKFGLYSMSASSLLSLISSNSFSIADTLSQNSNTAASLTWSYPTSTATSGYAYGTSFPGVGNITGTAQISSYISGPRIVGLQFGGEMTLTPSNYWLGILSYRSSTSSISTYGFSHAGIIGQIMNPINMPGTVSGLLPYGVAAGEWAQKNTASSGWWGRYMVGIISATTFPNFNGSLMPTNVSLIEINAPTASLTGSILPSFTFVST